jgi:hypothetical protein
MFYTRDFKQDYLTDLHGAAYNLKMDTLRKKGLLGVCGRCIRVS